MVKKINSIKSARPNVKGYIKKRRKTVNQMGEEANKQVDRLFINRLQSLAHSWRFVLSWMLLVVLLTWVLVVQARSLRGFYTEVVPRDGGTYVEGIVGPLTNMNPIYATTSADQSVSRLLFAGLMRYDENNNLVNDLADSIESNEKASQFTVKLKEDAVWHDGTELTSQDVVYTVRTIQQPDARSPLQRSWQGVVVEAIDKETVSFTLPGSFSPFPNLLTFGVLPKHILETYSYRQLRDAQFNSLQPVGSGPFKFQRIVNVARNSASENEIKVQLIANDDYHLGRPKLNAFTFWVAADSERLTTLFNEGQLSGAVAINKQALVTEDLGVSTKVFNQTVGTYLFFKTSNETLKNTQLRKALTLAVNVPEAISVLDDPVRRIYGPLLREQLGFDSAVVQTTNDPLQAEKILDELGWIKDETGYRQKEGKTLEFLITTQQDTDYQPVAEKLIEQFKEVGVKVELDLREETGFAENVLQNHVYSHMLLYGINIAVDPDVYPFWHSSQADENSTVRLNLSEYESATADAGLEGGRSRVEPEVRAAKYLTFLEAWVAHNPAVALYRPTFTYYELKNIEGPAGLILRSQIDRYRDVHMWTVLTDRVPYTQ